MFNARTVGGGLFFDGEQVAIDLEQDVSYQSLCGKCYLEESDGVLNNGRRERVDVAYGAEPDPDFA